MDKRREREGWNKERVSMIERKKQESEGDRVEE